MKRSGEAANQVITLNDAAKRLGVHYMTAYRYVRTGRLEARREGGQWVVDPQSLSDLGGELATGASVPGGESKPTKPGARSAPGEAGSARGTSRRAVGTAATHRRRQLVRTLVKGDEPAVWKQVQDLLASGMEPERLYLEVLIPVMHSIGEGWERGDLTVGAEHRASTVMVRVVGRLGPLFAVRGRKRGVIVLGAPSGDRHSLPVTFLADLLRGRRFEVVDLGADVPVEDFAEAAVVADRLVGVGVCATTASSRIIRSTIASLHDAGDGVVVVLGGAAVTDERTAIRLGADYYSSSAEAVLDRFDALHPI